MAKITANERLSLQALRHEPNPFFEESGKTFDDAIRDIILENFGISDVSELNPMLFRAKQYEVFAILSPMITVAVGQLLQNEFDQFINYQTIEHGDEYRYYVEDKSLFNVYITASGNSDIERQRLYKGKFLVETDWLSVKIYAELEDLLAGRVDWAQMITRLVESYGQDIGIRIYNAMSAAFNAKAAPFKQTGTFTEAKLRALIKNVRAASGRQVVIYGDTTALSLIQPTNKSDNMIDAFNELGYYGQFEGTPMVSLPASYQPNTTDFVVSEQHIYVAPLGEEMIHVVFEGGQNIEETGVGRTDQTREYLFQQKFGVGVVGAKAFGIYNFGE